jgi:hypothetical protein
MIKFKGLVLYHLSKKSHYRFFRRVTKEIAAAGAPVQTALGQLVVDLNDWFAKEKANLAWRPGSSLTHPIATAKRSLSVAFTGLTAHIRGSRYDTDPAIVKAGCRLYMMLKNYSYVISNPDLQKANVINTVLAHLNGDMAADAQTIGLTAWIVEVQNALDAFVDLIEQREATPTTKPKQSLREVRQAIDNTWRQIVAIVNAGAMLNESPDFAALINTINPEIERLNAESRNLMRHIAKTLNDPIEPQPCTGQACTPIPDLFYETANGMEKLTPGADFNIHYKNNVHPGTASCIIHGKGAYKGKKSIPFIISSQSSASACMEG